MALFFLRPGPVFNVRSPQRCKIRIETQTDPFPPGQHSRPSVHVLDRQIGKMGAQPVCNEPSPFEFYESPGSQPRNLGDESQLWYPNCRGEPGKLLRGPICRLLFDKNLPLHCHLFTSRGNRALRTTRSLRTQKMVKVSKMTVGVVRPLMK